MADFPLCLLQWMVIIQSGQHGLRATRLVGQASWRAGAHAQTLVLNMAAEIVQCMGRILRLSLAR